MQIPLTAASTSNLSVAESDPSSTSVPASATASATATASLCLLPQGGNLNPKPKYGSYNSPGVNLHSYNTLVRSSALARTLVSAEAFMDGMLSPTPLAANQSTTVAAASEKQVGCYRLEAAQHS
jgi:hypothetical protein